MRLLFSFLFILAFSIVSFSQESGKEHSNKISFSMSVGKTSGLSGKYRDSSIPAIISHNTQQMGGGVFNVGMGYQAYRWAIELNYEYAFYHLERQSPFLFIPGKEYPFQQKFPQYSVVDIYNDPLGYKYGQSTFLLGAGYKIRWKRFYIKPAFSLGVTSFNLPQDKVFMKDMNTNYSQEVSYKGQEVYNAIYRPGLTVDYNVFSRIHLFGKYEYAYSTPLIRYKLSIVNVLGEKHEQIEGGRETLNMNIFSIGITVELDIFNKGNDF